MGNKKSVILLKQFFYKIKKIIQWIPLLWHDGDWDYIYIYIMLKKKIERMQNYQKKYHHNNSIESMNICIKLLDKLIQEDFDTPEKEATTRQELFQKLNKYLPKWWV